MRPVGEVEYWEEPEGIHSGEGCSCLELGSLCEGLFRENEVRRNDLDDTGGVVTSSVSATVLESLCVECL